MKTLNKKTSNTLFLSTLFLAWKDPISRHWFPIGRLTFDGVNYQFIYIQGVKEAKEKCAFKPLASFPCLDEIYRSTYLFSVFANRLMSPSRPDYATFMKSLHILTDNPHPITILGRSGGKKQTDTLAVFPEPEVDEEGQYHLYFFSHGLRYLPSSAIERINQFVPGEKLWLAHEFQNSYDAQSLILNTEDHHIVGYCPRYLLGVIFDWLQDNYRLEVRVEHVNNPELPFQYRLLCKMTLIAPDGNHPFSSCKYQPLIILGVENTLKLR